MPFPGSTFYVQTPGGRRTEIGINNDVRTSGAKPKQNSTSKESQKSTNDLLLKQSGKLALNQRLSKVSASQSFKIGGGQGIVFKKAGATRNSNQNTVSRGLSGGAPGKPMVGSSSTTSLL